MYQPVIIDADGNISNIQKPSSLKDALRKLVEYAKLLEEKQNATTNNNR